jgi:hypothetical protein
LFFTSLTIGVCAFVYPGFAITSSAAACADGDCTDEFTTIYRAVSSDELADIQKSGIFQPHKNIGYQLQKLFTTNLEDAIFFANRFSQWENKPYSVISIDVPSSLVNKYITTMDARTVVSFPVGPILDQVNQYAELIKIIVK